MRFRSFTMLVVALVAASFVQADEKAASKSSWQPVLGKSFKGYTKDLRVTDLVVDRKVGCVFLLVEGKGVFCSSAGAKRFSANRKTWEQVCKLRSSDAKHRFALTETGIKESTDGGATWSQPIAPPQGFVITKETTFGYDGRNDILYLVNNSSDLYKLARGK